MRPSSDLSPLEGDTPRFRVVVKPKEAAVDVTVEERDFSAKRREALAAKGAAMEDGSFPIVNASDLANAVQAIGRAKDYDAAKAHIIKRARALGLTASLPSEWGIKEVEPAPLTAQDLLLLEAMGEPVPFAARGAEARSSAHLRVLEASKDDHFYGPWKGGSKSAGGGPAPEGPAQDDKDVKAVAKSIYDKSSKEEPAVTADIVDIGKLVNGDPDHDGALQYRLKSQGSLSRKIAADAREQGISPKQAGAGVKDAIRYTYVVKEGDYVDSYGKARAELEARGYKHLRSKNFWGEPPPQYQGINSVFVTPKGSYMELQFHTAASLKAKNLNHAIKEKWDAAPPGPYRDRLYARMAANEAKVPKPPDVYSIGKAATR